MLKAGKDAVSVPSVTWMTICEVTPTLAVPGVPVSAPEPVSNVAQVGLFTMEYTSFAPAESSAAGLKLYGAPTLTLDAGVPVTSSVGAAMGAVTEMANAVSDALVEPSLALMTMLG